MDAMSRSFGFGNIILCSIFALSIKILSINNKTPIQGVSCLLLFR